MSDHGGENTDVRTMVRAHVTINDGVFALAQDQDVEVLQRAIETTLHAGGGFVTFTVVGNRQVSALITTRSQVVFSVETVQFDERDTGLIAEPFGGLYDF